jgi:hypothetical protein
MHYYSCAAYMFMGKRVLLEIIDHLSCWPHLIIYIDMSCH